jgi:hypothetical protein
MKFWSLEIFQKANQISDFCPMKLGQKSVGFLGDLKTPKIHSEINRPLK